MRISKTVLKLGPDLPILSHLSVRTGSYEVHENFQNGFKTGLPILSHLSVCLQLHCALAFPQPSGNNENCY